MYKTIEEKEIMSYYGQKESEKTVYQEIKINPECGRVFIMPVSYSWMYFVKFIVSN